MQVQVITMLQIIMLFNSFLNMCENGLNGGLNLMDLWFYLILAPKCMLKKRVL